MLSINLNNIEFYEQSTNRFIDVNLGIVKLEHSLLSVSKWESIWEVPFLDSVPKTKEQEISYIRQMIIGKDDTLVVNVLATNYKKPIFDYINSKQTATVIRHIDDGRQKRSRHVVTSELIYYWMIAYSIPIELEKWHLNRLLTLIEICHIKSDPKANKMSHMDSAKYRMKLNEERKKAFGIKR